MMEEMKTLIRDEIEQKTNPPQLCKIMKIYDDGYIDAETNIGILTHIECIGTPTVGKKGLLIFVDNDPNQKIIIV